MDNQQTVQQEDQVQVQVQEQKTKEEHYDELDFIGGALFKGMKNLFFSLKNMIIPRKVE